MEKRQPGKNPPEEGCDLQSKQGVSQGNTNPIAWLPDWPKPAGSQSAAGPWS